MTLIERLKAATGPDRELDGDIFQSYGGTMWDKAYAAAQEPCGCPHGTAIEDARFHAPTFTSSIDVALALVERMLPGCGYMITRGRMAFDEPMFGVELYHMDLVPDDGEPVPYDYPSENNHLPTAILIALFTALQGEDTNADK